MRGQRTILAAAAAVVLLSAAAPAARADGWIGSWAPSEVFPSRAGHQLPDSAPVHAARAPAARKPACASRTRPAFTRSSSARRMWQSQPATAPPGVIDPATDHVLTFGGLGGVTVAARRGSGIRSDRVWTLPSLSNSAISLFIPRWTGPSVIHLDGVVIILHFRGAAIIRPPPSFRRRKPQRPGSTLTRSTCMRSAMPATVVTLGESITDGYRSEGGRATIAGLTGSPNHWRRCPAGAPVGVVNAGHERQSHPA